MTFTKRAMVVQCHVVTRNLLRAQALLLMATLASFTLIYVAKGQTDWVNWISIENRQSVVYISGTGLKENGLQIPIGGTGFIVRPEGYVLTCGHVVSPEYKEIKDLKASLPDHPEDTYSLTIVKRDPIADLMLVKLPENRSWQRVARIVSYESLNNMEVVAEGFALGLGIVDRPGIINIPTDKGYWLTTAPLEHGMSGGPVFNRLGEVVGIVEGSYSPAKSSDLVMPISLATGLLNTIQTPVDIFDRSHSGTPVRRNILEMYRYAVDGQGDSRFPINDLRTRLTDLIERLAGESDRPQDLPSLTPVENDDTFPDPVRLEGAWKAGLTILEIFGGTLFAKSNPTEIASTIYLGSLKGSLSSSTTRVITKVSAKDYNRLDTVCALTLYALAMDAKYCGAPPPEVQFYLAHAKGVLTEIELNSPTSSSSVEKELAQAVDMEFQKYQGP